MLILVILAISIRKGIEQTAMDFLSSGKKSLGSLQRELGFKDPIGISSTLEHIEKKFGLKNTYKGDYFFFDQCILHRTFEDNEHRIDVCMNNFREYSLITKLRTYRGTVFLSFVKPVDLNFSLEYLPILALFFIFFTLLACYGYAQISLLVITPVRKIHNYLTDNGSPDVGNIQEYKDLIGVIDASHEAVKNKAVVETLDMVVHNVQKPFFMIRNSLEQAEYLHGKELEAYIKKISPQIKKSSDTAEEIINSILDFSAERSLIREKIDIVSPIEGALSCFSFEARVEKTFQHSSLLLLDKIKILEAIMNLFSNIEDIRKKNADLRVWVQTKECKKWVTVIVGNTGSYIPQEKLSLVFQNFYTSGKEKGRGLGLSISKKYIESHGGMIWAESRDNQVEFIAKLPKEALV